MKNAKPFVIEIAIGIALMGMYFLIPSEYYAAMAVSAGFGIMGASAAKMVRTAYWKNPKRQEAYKAKKQEAYINSVDERKQFLAMKAGHISYQIMAYLLFVLSFLLALVHAEVWVIAMTFLLCLFQWALGMVVFRVLEKKL